MSGHLETGFCVEETPHGGSRATPTIAATMICDRLRVGIELLAGSPAWQQLNERLVWGLSQVMTWQELVLKRSQARPTRTNKHRQFGGLPREWVCITIVIHEFVGEGISRGKTKTHRQNLQTIFRTLLANGTTPQDVAYVFLVYCCSSPKSNLMNCIHAKIHNVAPNACRT